MIWAFPPFQKHTPTDFRGWKSPEDTDSDSEHLLSFIDCSVFSPLQCFNNYTNKHIKVSDRNGDKQTMNHFASSLTHEEVSMQLYYVFTPLLLPGKWSSSEIWVCVSISPSQSGCACRSSAGGVVGSWRWMRGRSGGCQRPGEGGGAGRTRGAGWVGLCHTPTHAYNLSGLWKGMSVQPTSRSPSLESIDSRPATAQNNFTTLDFALS